MANIYWNQSFGTLINWGIGSPKDASEAWSESRFIQLDSVKDTSGCGYSCWLIDGFAVSGGGAINPKLVGMVYNVQFAVDFLDGKDDKIYLVPILDKNFLTSSLYKEKWSCGT